MGAVSANQVIFREDLFVQATLETLGKQIDGAADYASTELAKKVVSSANASIILGGEIVKDKLPLRSVTGASVDLLTTGAKKKVDEEVPKLVKKSANASVEIAKKSLAKPVQASASVIGVIINTFTGRDSVVASVHVANQTAPALRVDVSNDDDLAHVNFDDAKENTASLEFEDFSEDFSEITSDEESVMSDFSVSETDTSESENE